WSGVPTPGSNQQSGSLNGVSCVSRSFCAAVGYDDSLHAPLASIWNGQSWEATAFDTTFPGGQLESVSCTSASMCLAVGFYADQGWDRPITGKWDGSTWSWASGPVVPLTQPDNNF